MISRHVASNETGQQIDIISLFCLHRLAIFTATRSSSTRSHHELTKVIIRETTPPGKSNIITYWLPCHLFALPSLLFVWRSYWIGIWLVHVTEARLSKWNEVLRMCLQLEV